MNFESNVNEVIARMKERADRARNPGPALAVAGSIVRDAAFRRFTANDWAPNSLVTIRRKGSSRPGIDTGTLRNSITSQVEDYAAVIGTNVRYARWFQEGTGVFAGHQPWRITRRGKVVSGSGGAMHQGQPARPFLFIDQTSRDRILAVFKTYIMTGELVLSA